jgi:hypothetical protein
MGEKERQLFLHLGLPKSGTTSLQDVMRHHREELLQQGFCHPEVGHSSHFLAALEMTQKHERWGRTAEEVSGTFAKLLEVGRQSGAPRVVISHEIFGQALPEQVPQILEAASDFEVSIILTVRDLGRVLPAAWQEWVKNGHKGTFDDFVALKGSRLPDVAEPGVLFWRIQNVAEVLDRWAPHVPSERVHLVPCPPPGSAPDELWRRFAEALGCDPSVIDISEVPTSNVSIGAAQVTFLARVNRALGTRLPQPHADRLRKHWLAQQLLSKVDGVKAVAPPDVVERFAAVSHEWVRTIKEREVVIHGDLDDLLPRITSPAETGKVVRHPDDTTAEEQLEGLHETVAEMLLRIWQAEERATQAEERARAAEARTKQLLGAGALDRGRHLLKQALKRRP